MTNCSHSFIKASGEVIEEYGIDAVRRWANDPNPTIAAMFSECLQVAAQGVRS